MEADDRPLSTHELAGAKDVLRTAQIGFLAMSDDEPYVVPINFVYVDTDVSAGLGRILFHTGEGRKSRALEKDPRVCMSALSDAVFVRGSAPCDDGFTYRSVLAWGRARLLEVDAEREASLRSIVAKYDPAATDRQFDEKVFEQTLVYSITIESLGFKQRPRRS